MDSILSPAEIDFYIETMREYAIHEVGSDNWLDWHDRLQKLNQQAVIEATSMRDEQVKETLTTFGKSHILVHEAILISIWKQKVLPHLLKFVPNPETTFIAYTVLYHEAIAASLLELIMFYGAGCERLGDSAADLLEYVYENAAQLLVIKCEPTADVCQMSGQQEILRNKNDLHFTIAIRSLSIIRYLAEYMDRVSLGVVSRMYETYDVPALFVQLLIEKPWYKNGQVFNKGKWVNVSSDVVNTTEAQVWLTLRHLLLDKAFNTYYPITDSRKSHLMKIAPLLNPIVIDQMSPLLELKQFLFHLSVYNPQSAAKKPLLMETILEVKNNIIQQGHGQWKKIAKAQIDVIFCNDKEKLAQIAQKLSAAYNTDVIEKFEGNASGECALCGQPAIQRCSKCRKDFYCSRQCQVSHWQSHKDKCTPLAIEN
ncbi:zinc finger MYND domain-containing protein 10 [Atheta coriaria]|uniref:zinc finger MYND domain-containing protein 10 n=1 Tax=Dalotia coriaria TaxID=877792 RepID=UPI0031F401F3